ncbi:MAG: ComEC family competence protein [Acetobacteraceae bacterium]|nr:ComEC family competence protein [Acetobacteraceae bacterium]
MTGKGHRHRSILSAAGVIWAHGWLAAWWDRLREAEQGRFVLWLPVFMGAGVLAYFDLRFEPPPWLAAKIAAAAFAAAIALSSWTLPRALALVAGFAALGFASAQYTTARLPPIETHLPGKAMMVSGTVRAVEILPHARRITLKTVTLNPDERPPGRGRPVVTFGDPAPPRHLIRDVRLRLAKGDDSVVATGDLVRIRAISRQPMPPSMPGGWDTQRDAYFAGLGASGWALGRLQIVNHALPDRFASWVQWLRETIGGRIMAAVPGAEGTIAVTLLTGAARSIPPADHAAFRDSGLAHILAVAGLHIGIVMGFALAGARTAMALSERASLFWPTRKIAAVFALAVGGGYMILTGAHVPIVRSFAMACLFTLALLAGRQPVSVRGLGLAGIALMTIAPYEVPGVSFQMSFSAVLALISGYETLRPWLRRLYGKSWGKRLGSHLVALALTSTLAGTASLPYGAYHFGHVQLYYIFSNMAAVPLTALWVMPAGMIALLLIPLGLEALALVPMGWGVTLIIWIARGTAALPAATLPVPHLSEWGLAVLSVGIAWLGIWRSRIRLLGILAIAIGIASPMFDRPPDILLSGDGGLIGFRTEQGVFLQETRSGSSFTRDAWLTRWYATTAAKLPVTGEAADGALRCVKDRCLFQPRPDAKPVLLMRGPSKPDNCKELAAIVSAEPARGLCHYPGPKLVDRFTVWKQGPAAIWLEPGGVLVLTDREARGTRPWVPPPPKPRPRPVSNLPLAPLDGAGR